MARSAFQMQPGLRARFFASTDQTGEAARTLIDAGIDTAALSRGWSFAPPDRFSVRWSGYLFAERSGEYQFTTTSDDGSELYLDGRLVVDNSAAHGLATQSGAVHLDRGSHAVTINYLNAGDAYHFEWTWARNGEAAQAVPVRLLSARPRGYGSLIAIRTLDWLWPLSAVIAFILFAFVLGRRWWPARQDAPAFRIGLRPASVCLVVCAAAAVAQTWPLARDPAHLSRNDNADTMLNEWTIAWVAHALPRAPAHLFDANMFYPDRDTLAYSESMIVQGVMAMPAFALGASPVLAYNLVLLAGFTLTAGAVSLLVASWTGDWFAGTAAGLMVAFNTHTLTRLPHLQAQHVEFLPLALLALDAMLNRPRWRITWWLAAWFVLQALTSVYLLVFTTIALLAGFLVRPEDWFGRRALAVLPRLAAASLAAVAALTPFLVPYWRVRAAGMGRSIDEAAFFAATYRDYATTVSRFHTYMPPGGSSALFPGFAVLALSAVALVSGKAFRDPRARMCVAFGAAGVLLSFGPAVAPGYEFLFTKVPLLSAIRTSSRFGYLGLFALAVLAAYGFAMLRARLTSRPVLNGAVTCAVLVVVFLEPFAAPISYVPFTGVPAIYNAPASDPRAVVAELPLAPPAYQFRDGQALLDSTRNWRPLLNGYSGFTPPGYVQRYIAMNTFPAREAVTALQQAGVNTLFVHMDQYGEDARAAMQRDPALRRVESEGSVVLYTLAPR